MESITSYKSIQILREKKVNLFGTSDARNIFNVQNDNTLYKFLQRMEEKKIIRRVANGKYLFMFGNPSDFEVANYIVSPSYISFESALSFYGILSQFPYSITSVTTKKSVKNVFDDKEYEYSHIDKKFYFSYIKKDRFLIATPEKALIDQLYFTAKKLKSSTFLDELDLKSIDKKYFYDILKKYDYTPLKRLAGKYVG
jgi:predicted transcriptional regulator of viral defense system